MCCPHHLPQAGICPSRGQGVHASTELSRDRARGQGRRRAGESCAALRSLSPYPGPPSAPAHPTGAHPAHRGFPLRLRLWVPSPGRQGRPEMTRNRTRRQPRFRIMADLWVPLLPVAQQPLPLLALWEATSL